mgnify:FL=1
MSHSSYALITGASMGIGAALAKECARLNRNLILVSLPGEGLPEKSAALSKEFEIVADYFETDLCEERNIEALFQFVESKKIGIGLLINNAGIGSVGEFEHFSPQFYSRQVKLNSLAPVLLTLFFLPLLQAEHQAYILNVSSLGSFFNIPNKEVYCASKSFVYSFSNALRASLYDTNISVSVVCPGPVDTNERLLKAHRSMKGLAKMAVMSPEAVAQYTMLSVLRKRRVIVPGKLNRISLLLNRLVPHPLKRILILREMKRQASLAAGHGID